MHRRFIAFYRTQQPRILNSARARLDDPETAEDITAEVFRLAWEKRAVACTLTFPWVYTTMRNLIGHEYRKIRRPLQHRDEFGAQCFLFNAVTENPSQLPGDDDEILDTRFAVRLLPEADRELIWMHYWEQLTLKEISRLLDCREATARVRIHRARQRLRALVDGI